MEELRAEIASAMLSNVLGIPSDIPNHSSYVEGWLEVLRKDRRAIFSAARDAQKIADWCLSRHPAYVAKMHAEPTADEIEGPTAASSSATSTRPIIPAAIAAMGSMPRHIARRLYPDPAAVDVPPTPTPAQEEGATWAYRPR
jgi:hypothetical protein